MKTIKLATGLAIAGLILIATAASAQHYPPYPGVSGKPHTDTIEMGSCMIISAFDAADIQRIENSSVGRPDTIYYDLAMMSVKQFRVITYDTWGNNVYAETINRCTPAPKHFEITENIGNEFFLGKQVRYFIKQQEMYRCPAEIKCILTQ